MQINGKMPSKQSMAICKMNLPPNLPLDFHFLQLQVTVKKL